MATRTCHFTKAKIAAIQPPEVGRDLYRDDKEQYLYIFVTKAGSKSFYYVRKWEGRTAQIRLDTFPNMAVAQARKRCEELSGDYAVGKNPAQAKRERRGRMTFGGLFDTYIEDHARHRKRTWRYDVQMRDRYLSTWTNKPIDEFEAEFIQAWHNKLKSKSGASQADRTLALVKSVFYFAIKKRRWLPPPNPCYGVEMFGTPSRDRWLDGDELAAFFVELEREPSKRARDFFKVLLFTGARKGNVLAMRWKDIDFGLKRWNIPEEVSKNGEPLTVHLHQRVLDILNERFDENEAPRTIRSKHHPPRKSLYVFPSRNYDTKTGHLVEPKRAWRDILERAHLENVRVHDLRRTLGSWQAMRGQSLLVIGESLGHKDTKSTEVYSRINKEAVAASVDDAVDAMLATVAAAEEGGSNDKS